MAPAGFDEWKRRRLLGVGADAVIPDFRDAIPLVITCSADDLHGRGFLNISIFNLEFKMANSRIRGGGKA